MTSGDGQLRGCAAGVGGIVLGQQRNRLGRYLPPRGKARSKVSAGGAKFGPLGDCDRAATVVIAARGWRLDMAMIIVGVMHLAHAAGVHGRRGDRQCHGSEDTHERQRQQNSGGQLMHECGRPHVGQDNCRQNMLRSSDAQAALT